MPIPIRRRAAIAIALLMACGSVGAARAHRSAEDPNVSDGGDSSKRMADGRQWTTRNLSAQIDQSYCYGDEEANTALLIGGSSGFDARLGGNREADGGTYARLEAHGLSGTASETDPANAVFVNFGKGSQALYRQGEGEKQMAVSARRVRN